MCYNSSKIRNPISYYSSMWILAVSLSMVEKTCPVNDQGTATRNRQIIVEIPANLDISPAIVFRYLGEKFVQTSDYPNEMSLPDYLFRPKQTSISLSNIIDVHGSTKMASPLDRSASSSSSSSEVSYLRYNEVSIIIFNRSPELKPVF